MDYKAAYILGYMLSEVALLIAAAHFGGGWAIFFILLVVLSGFAFKARMDRWDGPL